MGDYAFTTKERAYFKKMFNLFDTDKSGSIGFFEMKNLAKHLGVELSDDHLRQSIEKIDINHSGELDFDEFLLWIHSTQKSGDDEFAALKAKIKAQGSRTLTNQQIQQLKEAFQHFDTDSSGSIDVHELQKVFEAMGQSLSHDELMEMISQIDDDGNSEIDFEEFMLLMCSNFGNYQSFEEEMMEEFQKRDPKQTGLMTLQALAAMIRELTGSHLSNEELDEIMKSADERKDGTIEYMKWEALWEACRSR